MVNHMEDSLVIQTNIKEPIHKPTSLLSMQLVSMGQDHLKPTALTKRPLSTSVHPNTVTCLLNQMISDIAMTSMTTVLSITLDHMANPEYGRTLTSQGRFRHSQVQLVMELLSILLVEQ